MLKAKCLKEDADKTLQIGCVYLVEQVGCDVLVYLPHGMNRYLGMFPASWFGVVQQ
nr:MAG TPA: hypothetical protein [Caudoviricetes sp.]